MSPINDEEVKELKDKVNQHSNKISTLEEDVDILKSDVTDIKATQIKTDEQLKFIIQGQQDLKDVMAQNNSTIIQAMNFNNQLISQLITNNTQKEIAENKNQTDLQITKENNKSGLIQRLLIVGAAFFTGKNLGDISNWIKDLFK